MPITDPYRAYNFKLEIQGATAGHFTECSGLGVKVDVIKYREAGNSQIVRAIPGPVEYNPVTLKYGVTTSRELWEWMTKAAAGTVERKNVSIVLLDSDSVTELMRWDLLDAWPSEWQGAPLNASSQAVAIESLTLVFDGLKRT
jgi:phage tail-like protein